MIYADLLTTPYVAGGRTAAGMDCVGFFLEMQRRLGHILPCYASETGVLDIAIAQWEKVAVPELGVAALLYSDDPRWHLAVALDEHRIIHMRRKAGVVIERLDSPLNKRMIEGFYRWKGAR